MKGGHKLTRIIEKGHRQCRPVLTDFYFGPGKPHFPGQPGPPVILSLLPVTLAIRDDTVRAPATTTVQAIGKLPRSIEPELYRPRGVAGGEAQVEALGPAAIARGPRVGPLEITVDIKIAQAQVQLAVLREIAQRGQWHHCAEQAHGLEVLADAMG
ncbi:hypothetical protein D3C76_1101520 [compost metagenome]